MTQIHDMFNEGFRSHADALARSGGLGEEFEQGAVKSIRRRRNVRAAGFGAGSALAIGAVGVAAWAVPGVRDGMAAPAGTQGCEINPYLPPSPASLGDAPFMFRAYVDLRPDTADPKVVVVYQDGKYVDLTPSSSGEYVINYEGEDYVVASTSSGEMYLSDSAMVLDWHTPSSRGGGIWDGVNPYLVGYGWTTTVPDYVPKDIDLPGLSSTFDLSINGGSGGGWQGWLSDSAVTDLLVTSNGTISTAHLSEGDYSPTPDEIEGASRVEMRVSGLPDGETFSIVSTFDANNIPELTCLTSSVDATPIPDPTGTQGCEINPYLPINPDSLAAPTYSYRTYVDLRPGTERQKVVAVFPDGTYVLATLDEEGAFRLDDAHGGFEVANLDPLYPGEHESAWVVDHFANGGSGGSRWDGATPNLAGYGWTTEVPLEVPDGIDVNALASTFDIAINAGGTGYLPGSVPNGAVTDVIITSDEEVTTTRLEDGDPAPSADEGQGATRVEMRVSGLPDGGTFSIVSTYDANDIPEPTCLPEDVDPALLPN
ncbi:hypothetical protein [Demequina aurantiaca]|uniref:hypothetical protein n=1 Tax=Demequina aurantiaca TaxID=676200 RepID=UPI003D357239